MSRWVTSPKSEVLCELLRRRRERAGVNQDIVANALGVSQSYVCDYEAARKRLDFFQLERIAVTIGTTRCAVLRDLAERARLVDPARGPATSHHVSKAERDAWASIASLSPSEADAAAQLGSLLTSIRKGSNLRQVDIGAALRRPQSWVSLYEHGKVRLDVIQLEDVAVELGTTLLELDQLLSAP